MTGQLYVQIIRCFVGSLDQEWIPTSCKPLCWLLRWVCVGRRFLISLGWVLVCEIFVKIPGLHLTEAFMLAQVVAQMGSCKLSHFDQSPIAFGKIYGFHVVIPIFLREVETVTSHCENHSILSLPTELLQSQLENLIAMLHFVVLATRADIEICENSVPT